MSNIAATFSGKFGDILWGLATARELSVQAKCKLDFYCMPQYEALLPLLRQQSYIDKAFTILGWKFEGSPFGDQPAQPQQWAEESSYEKVYHLTYRCHPVMPLIDAIAAQQGVQSSRFLSWIDTGEEVSVEPRSENFVAVGFNSSYRKEKADFASWLKQAMEIVLNREVEFVNVMNYPFLEAARKIRRAKFFVGCRSSNYVLAHGVGQRCLVYEPGQSRRPATFGNPHGVETMPELVDQKGFLEQALLWWKE